MAENRQRIGLLGGTFDPPHLGHLWLAETAREQLNLDQVIFLPAGHPPHKLNQPVTAVSHRLAMLRLALADATGFKIDTIDIEREPPHTTSTLLPLLRHRYPRDQFWLLVGTDSLRDLSQWREPEQIIRQCRLAALPRPGVKMDLAKLAEAIPGVQLAVDLLSGPTLDLSSTEIRQWARKGHSLRYLLHAGVNDYIQQMGLYSISSKAP